MLIKIYIYIYLEKCKKKFEWFLGILCDYVCFSNNLVYIVLWYFNNYVIKE